MGTTTGNLVKWYKKGFVDEIRGSSSVESDNASENKAYSIGANHAALGAELCDDSKILELLTTKY
jgi:hypothetical protein